MVAAAPAVTGPRTRRTQAERRAATRSALLEATIASIVEQGYASTTTRGIAERAGVTAGAQAHYFGSKAELVTEALGRLTARLAEDMIGLSPPRGRSPARRAEEILDGLWEVHRGSPFPAVMELWVAARTDEELRERLRQLERDVSASVAEGIAHVFGELAGNRSLVEVVTTALATMRGLAMLRFVTDRDVDRIWPATRAHLVTIFVAIQED